MFIVCSAYCNTAKGRK